MEKKLFRSIVALCAIAALFALAVLQFDAIVGGLKILKAVLTPVIAGVLIALFIDRPYKMYYRLFARAFHKAKHKNKLTSGFSVALTYITLLTFIAIFLVAVVPEVSASVTLLLANVSTYVSNIEDALNSFIAGNEYLAAQIEPFDFSEWEAWMISTIGSLVDLVENRLPEIFDLTKSIAGGVTNAILSLIISIYIMLDRNHLKWQIKKLIHAIFPKNVPETIEEIAKLTTNTLSGYISGRIIGSVIVGLICFIFLKIFGFEYAVLISFMVGVTNIIPMIGPFIGAIPSAFLLLLVNPMQCLWFIIFILVLQQLDGNLLDPLIAGESTGLPTLWVLVSITIGGGLFGILGFILSVPIFAVIFTLIKRYANRRLKEKGFPLNSEPNVDPVSKRLTLKDLNEKLKLNEIKERICKKAKKSSEEKK